MDESSSRRDEKRLDFRSVFENQLSRRKINYFSISSSPELRQFPKINTTFQRFGSVSIEGIPNYVFVGSEPSSRGEVFKTKNKENPEHCEYQEINIHPPSEPSFALVKVVQQLADIKIF